MESTLATDDAAFRSGVREALGAPAAVLAASLLEDRLIAGAIALVALSYARAAL